MSANYNDQDGFMYIVAEMDPYWETMMLSSFDAQVDFDIKDIEFKLKQTKTLKKLCVLKLLILPIEYTYYLIFISKKMASLKIKELKLSISLLRNKIGFDEFKREYNKLVLDSVK